MAAGDDMLDPHRLKTLYTDLDRTLLDEHSNRDTIAAVARLAAQSVPGAQEASISHGRHGQFRTLAATGTMASIGDTVQYELGTGPCVDAMLDDAVLCSGDIASDTRWPEFGRRVHEATGATSMLSLRIFLDTDDGITGLNLYSAQVNAFATSDRTMATAMATHAAVILIAAAARERVANLERALDSCRRIGMAIGVLMCRDKVQADDAFTLLRTASQNTNRKLADIAKDVITTGTLELPAPNPPAG